MAFFKIWNSINYRPMNLILIVKDVNAYLQIHGYLKQRKKVDIYILTHGLA